MTRLLLALLPLWTLTACASATDKSAPTHTAPPPPANDAPPSASPEAEVDAGQPAPGSGFVDLSQVRRPSVQHPRVEVYDRVVLSLLDSAIDDDALKKEAEARTGGVVVEVRRGALQIRLLRFAPTSPARTLEDQKRLVDQLSGMPGVKYVEGDRWMTPKGSGVSSSMDSSDAGVAP